VDAAVNASVNVCHHHHHHHCHHCHNSTKLSFQLPLGIAHRTTLLTLILCILLNQCKKNLLSLKHSVRAT